MEIKKILEKYLKSKKTFEEMISADISQEVTPEIPFKKNIKVRDPFENIDSQKDLENTINEFLN